jgi:N-acetylmuramoyl-L-alanine amidase
MRDINSLIVHCSATPPSMDIGAKEIKKWHVDGNKWSDIGYHYVIRRSGMIEPGRPISKPGAHAKGYNGDSIGVCLVGGVDSLGQSEFNYTFNQMAALRTVIEAWKGKQVFGHRDLDSSKDCPCFDVSALFG